MTSEDMVSAEKLNLFERHAQTALAMLVVALLVWVGSSVQQTEIAVAELRIEIQYLKASFEKPTKRIDELERRVRDLESREHEELRR